MPTSQSTPPAEHPDHALVLFSGGQDSTTCLAWALARYPHVETIGFLYGQRHVIEMTCRATIRAAFPPHLAARLGPDHVIDITAGLAALGETAMTADRPIETGEDGLPTTFVPGRNLLFLTYAAALAWRRGLRRIIAGVCETDYSGYPDCRDDTIKAMQLALNLGMARRFVLETPLMWRDKAQTWAMAAGYGLTELVVEHTHTCYLGDRAHRHAWGYGCGTCPACQLRAAGYAAWQTTLAKQARDAEGAILRVETSFQDTPDDGFYFVLRYAGRPLSEQLEELGLKDRDKVILWEEDCNLELKATLLFDYKHPMLFERALWAREEQEDSPANNRIQPLETELIGKWVVEDGRARGDATCERVNWLTQTYLVPLAYNVQPPGRRQETLYKDPGDCRLWERSFQQSEMHGDGPPRLVLLTPQQAAEKYNAVVVHKF